MCAFADLFSADQLSLRTEAIIRVLVGSLTFFQPTDRVFSFFRIALLCMPMPRSFIQITDLYRLFRIAGIRMGVSGILLPAADQFFSLPIAVVGMCVRFPLRQRTYQHAFAVITGCIVKMCHRL